MVSCPSLIHIGIQKTGSTFFTNEIFTKHPRITLLNSGLTASGEYSDSAFFSKFVNSSHFKGPANALLTQTVKKSSIHLISEENLSGAIYTSVDMELLANRLYSYFPNSKILIVLRNQIDWLASAYSNYVYRGGVKAFEVGSTQKRRDMGGYLKNLTIRFC